jgi:hypothetical protein
VSAALGHTNIRTTATHYAKVLDALKTDAADRLGDYIMAAVK